MRRSAFSPAGFLIITPLMIKRILSFLLPFPAVLPGLLASFITTILLPDF
jgi:hypothetical protein